MYCETSLWNKDKLENGQLYTIPPADRQPSLDSRRNTHSFCFPLLAWRFHCLRQPSFPWEELWFGQPVEADVERETVRYAMRRKENLFLRYGTPT